MPKPTILPPDRLGEVRVGGGGGGRWRGLGGGGWVGGGWGRVGGGDRHMEGLVTSKKGGARKCRRSDLTIGVRGGMGRAG